MSTPLGSKRSVSKCNPILTSVRVWCENVSGVCPGGIGETGAIWDTFFYAANFLNRRIKKK